MTSVCQNFIHSKLFFPNLFRLPVEGANGEALVAEATVSGKKKEAVVACALEACRLLDMHGILHASKHGIVQPAFVIYFIDNKHIVLSLKWVFIYTDKCAARRMNGNKQNFNFSAVQLVQ